MMAWSIQPWLLFTFVTRRLSYCPCLLAAVVWWVQVCRNDACRQSSAFSPVFLTNSYLLSNLLSSDTFTESLDKILLELHVYGHLIFSSRGNGGAKVCDAESLLSLLSLLCFSLFRVPHSIRSLMLPLLCRGSMHSLSLLIALHILAIAAFYHTPE
jgi:hypothetical protein